MLYALLNVFTVTSDTIAKLLWIFRSLRASRILHSQLLESVFTATFRWLDVTPVGRIITRCTQDISSVDQELESFAFMLMRLTIALLAFFVSAVLMAGWYAFIPGILLALLGGFLGIVYLKCQLCIRREMSNAKAPILSQVSTALASLRKFSHSICLYGKGLNETSQHPYEPTECKQNLRTSWRSASTSKSGVLRPTIISTAG